LTPLQCINERAHGRQMCCNFQAKSVVLHISQPARLSISVLSLSFASTPIDQLV
jgi:hypothetical protein